MNVFDTYWPGFVFLGFVVGVLGFASCEPKSTAKPKCDDATKPLVIECITHGGGNCIQQVERLNSCAF